MEQGLAAKARGQAEEWEEAEVPVAGEAVVLQQVPAVLAFAPTAEKEYTIRWGRLAMRNIAPTAEPP